MKFKFDKNLDYQLEAIQSVVDIFDTGKNIASSEQPILQNPSPVIANELEIDEARIKKNIKAIQKQNNIEDQESDENIKDYTVEMETGTGKTYVYLRTIFELNKKYGLKKFIILVPSVAIKEGVLKTIDQTKAHFRELYENVGFSAFEYNSSKLNKVRNFASSNDIQIMVMTVQSFDSDTKVMRQFGRDGNYHADTYIELVAMTRPVVVMDEPQNMEGELKKSSIKELNALFRLRYSATHKTKHNLMYVLSPVDAYIKGLVKKIEVFGVDDQAAGDLILKVLEIITKKNQRPTARVAVEIKTASGDYLVKSITVKNGDDLEIKTENEKYKGLQINEISVQYGSGFVELSSGEVYKIEEEISVDKEAIFRAQIKETIKAHFEKQERFGDRIKVLSLFFIDKVANYQSEGGIIRKIFEEEFEKLKGRYSRFSGSNVREVHNGYFASQKVMGEVIYKETSGRTKADKEVYDLIMKDKEKLLSFAEPTAFIFSHSALKEGWDNPNIFQICTLRETNSPYLKRQEIGRGLRLPVDVEGSRIFDSKINILTVVPNESYREFVGGLQTEYTDAGYKKAPSAGNARETVRATPSQKHLESEEFKELWRQISTRTKYNVELKSDELIKNVVDEINKRDVNNLVVRVEKVMVDMNAKDGIRTIYEGESVGEKLDREVRIGNVCSRMARETGVTKATVFEILSRVNNLDLIFENPEEYIRTCIVLIKGCMNDLLINEGLKYIPIDDAWEVSLFEEWNTYKNKTIDSEKSVYNYVVWDSDGERQFAEHLEARRNVKLFTKLPPKFVVDTPLGEYNPDWAIVVEEVEGDKLYLVRETKFGGALDNLRKHEEQKIFCGKKHFEAIGFDNFKTVEGVEGKNLI